MKPTSYIFLIVAVVLAIGGLCTMRVAEGLAAKEGVELLGESSEDTGENSVFRYDYDSDSIGKISLNLKDAKINVVGGAEQPYIELVNFPEGMYEFSSSNRILTVSNNSDFSSVSGIASLALNFKGLRGLVNYVNISGRDKTVNVYLCDANPVKVVDIKAADGEISIEGGNTQTDYNIELEKGALSINRVATTSALNIKIKDGGALLENCAISNLSAELEAGDMNIVTSDISKISAELSNGDFIYGYRYDLDYVNLDLLCQVGKIKVNGVDKGGRFEDAEKPTNALYKITLKNGDITIDSNKTDTAADTSAAAD